MEDNYKHSNVLQKPFNTSLKSQYHKKISSSLIEKKLEYQVFLVSLIFDSNFVSLPIRLESLTGFPFKGRLLALSSNIRQECKWVALRSALAHYDREFIKCEQGLMGIRQGPM